MILTSPCSPDVLFIHSLHSRTLGSLSSYKYFQTCTLTISFSLSSLRLLFLVLPQCAQLSTEIKSWVKQSGFPDGFSSSRGLQGDPTVPEKREINPAPSNAPPSMLKRFAKDSSFGLSAAGSAASSAMPGGNSHNTSRATEARGLEGQANAELEGRALGDLGLNK